MVDETRPNPEIFLVVFHCAVFPLCPQAGETREQAKISRLAGSSAGPAEHLAMYPACAPKLSFDAAFNTADSRKAIRPRLLVVRESRGSDKEGSVHVKRRRLDRRGPLSVATEHGPSGVGVRSVRESVQQRRFV